MDFFTLIAAEICVTLVLLQLGEAVERTASLIVLPPIVLGYDDLYEDLKDKQETKKPEEKLKMRAETVVPNITTTTTTQFPLNLESNVINAILLQYLKRNLITRQADTNTTSTQTTITTTIPSTNNKNQTKEAEIKKDDKIQKPIDDAKGEMHLIQEGNIPLLAKGLLRDPNEDDALHFQGKFVLPDKLFDCPCGKQHEKTNQKEDKPKQIEAKPKQTEAKPKQTEAKPKQAEDKTLRNERKVFEIKSNANIKTHKHRRSYQDV